MNVDDSDRGLSYSLPPLQRAEGRTRSDWEVIGTSARGAGDLRVEVSTFPLASAASGPACRERARSQLSAVRSPMVDQETTADQPAAIWSFRLRPPKNSGEPPTGSRWAFFPRGSDCLVLEVSGPAADPALDRVFSFAVQSFRSRELDPIHQRDADLLAGQGFLERREFEAAFARFEAASRQSPELAKPHYLALVAGFYLGAPAYSRALPHGERALAADHALMPEQRKQVLRAMGVMLLVENRVKEAAAVLAELIVRDPQLSDGQYNYACAQARLGNSAAALEHLELALRQEASEGTHELVEHARSDDDLKSLRGLPAFERLLQGAKAVPLGPPKGGKRFSGSGGR